MGEYNEWLTELKIVHVGHGITQRCIRQGERHWPAQFRSCTKLARGFPLQTRTLGVNGNLRALDFSNELVFVSELGLLCLAVAALQA